MKDGKYTFILKDPTFTGNIRVFIKLSPSSTTEFYSFYLGFDNTNCDYGHVNSMLRQPRFNKYVEMFESQCNTVNFTVSKVISAPAKKDNSIDSCEFKTIEPELFDS